jgi:penicillin-binding protein 1C
VHKFYEELQRFKLRDINKQPDHYGLSLILGGARKQLGICAELMRDCHQP